MLSTDEAHTQMPCGTGVAQKCPHPSTSRRPARHHLAVCGAGQSRARSREPGESAPWHRCRHVELNVQIRPPSGLKADWGRPPRGQYANWYANQPDSGGVRGCTPTYAKRSDLQKLDTHEHRRTHCLNLGVKWSQLQILSARPMSARPRSHGFTCGYSFHEVASWDRLGPVQQPVQQPSTIATAPLDEPDG